MEMHCFRTTVALERYSATRELWDTPLFESKSFIAVPSVGALVPGWLLVVPRLEILSFAQLSRALFDELEGFVADVGRELESNFGAIALFEHGASRKTSMVGCGVDYAHLHLVPTEIDLRAGAAKIAPDIGWERVTSLNGIQRLERTEEYWFVQQALGEKEAYVGRCFEGPSPSQLFRRVIASALGTPDAYDWKEKSGAEHISTTVETLAPLVATA